MTTGSHQAAPRWRRWPVRLLAFAALIGTGTLVVAIIREGAGAGTAAPGAMTPQLQRIATGMEVLGDVLEDLRPGGSPSRAREAVRDALADQAAAVQELRRRQAAGSVPGEALVVNALEAQAEYLDAVGSVLTDPASSLRSVLRKRARRVRAAFAALPDPEGIPDEVRGWRRLAAWADARA